MAGRLRRWAAVGVASGVLGLGVAWAFSGGPRRPDVILISIDSLRPDHLGCYGYERNSSPVIDRLAREGVLFETVTSSSSWTLPAHAALFTGLPDSVHGCKDTGCRLAEERATLAEAFQRAGYRTAGFFAGPLLHPAFGFGQGFYEYVDCTSYPERANGLRPGGEPHELHDLSHQDVTNPRVLAEVAAWLARNRRGPRFLFIHLWDVHFDFIPPPPYDTMFDPEYRGGVDGRGLVRLLGVPRPKQLSDRDLSRLVALYDGEIRWTDHVLGRILNEVDKYTMDRNTVVAVTSDHGEAFYEHGRFGHRQSLHEEELRIPLIFHAPGRLEAGLRIGRPARIIDIGPTLLELAGAPPLEQALGRSLAPLLRDPECAWEEPLAVAELFEGGAGLGVFALRAREWKHITDYRDSSERLYDLVQDPGEQRPLPPARFPFSQEHLWELRVAVTRFLEEASRSLATPASGREGLLPSLTERQLRSLGYLK